MQRIGWWNPELGHVYKRRSVEKDVESFVGWSKLEKLMHKVPEWNHDRNKALFTTIFLTGGRIEEVLELTRDNFTVNRSEIIVNDMPLLKRYEKTGNWIEWVDKLPKNKKARLYLKDENTGKFSRRRFQTENKPTKRREFRLSSTERFTDILLDWLDHVKTGRLFTGYSDHLSYMQAYRIIVETGEYPHWLRAQRASCLVSEYGWPMEMMMEWMGWEELSTARHYARYGSKMLVPGKLTVKT